MSPRGRALLGIAAVIAAISLINMISGARMKSQAERNRRDRDSVMATNRVEDLQNFKKAIADKNWQLARSLGALIATRYGESAEVDTMRTLVRIADSALNMLEVQREASIDSAFRTLRVKKDSVTDDVFYFAPGSPAFGTRNSWELYIAGNDPRSATLRFRFYYEASEWLFIESAKVKIDDSPVEDFPFPERAVKRDNCCGKIWEHIDLPASDLSIATIERIAAANRAIVRYGGRYTKDWSIPAEQIRGMKRVLAVYRLANPS